MAKRAAAEEERREEARLKTEQETLRRKYEEEHVAVAAEAKAATVLTMQMPNFLTHWAQSHRRAACQALHVCFDSCPLAAADSAHLGCRAVPHFNGRSRFISADITLILA